MNFIYIVFKSGTTSCFSCYDLVVTDLIISFNLSPSCHPMKYFLSDILRFEVTFT